MSTDHPQHGWKEDVARDDEVLDRALANLPQDARPATDMPAPQATCERLPGAGMEPNLHGICPGCQQAPGLALHKCSVMERRGDLCNCCPSCIKVCEDLL